MKNRKNSPISFGITLTTDKWKKSKNSKRSRAVPTDCRGNTLPEKIQQMSLNEFDCPRTKMPPAGKPFTPDLFTCEPRPLPHFPPPRKLIREEERVQKEQERFRYRTEWHPSSKRSFSVAVSVAWEIFKVVCVGVFVVFKYAFIAVSVIITIGCFMCAGRPTSGLK